MHRYYLAFRALLLRLRPYPRRKFGFNLYDVDPDTPVEGPFSKPGGDLFYDIRTKSGWIAIRRPRASEKLVLAAPLSNCARLVSLYALP